MKTKSLTHEEIARCAYESWHSRGCPGGCDTEIWLEAERQLAAGAPEPQPSGSAELIVSSGTSDRDLAIANGGAALTDPVEAKPATGHLSGFEVRLPSPDDLAAKSAYQKEAARAPRMPTGKNAPMAAPPESGKPLWDKPHSS